MYPRENDLVKYVVLVYRKMFSMKVSAIAIEPFNFTASANGNDIARAIIT